MSKVLQLVGLKTYAGAGTKGVCVYKNQTAKFNDDVADKVLEGGRYNAENEFVPYFVEVDEASPTYDFTTEDTPKQVGTSAPPDTPPVRKSQRQRSMKAAAAPAA